MHILVSLPLDTPVEADILLANVRQGLGSVGKNCELLPLFTIEGESIDCLFECEERVSLLEELIQDCIKRYLVTGASLSKEPVSGLSLLGKTFDHFLKSFQWDRTAYPLSLKMSDLLLLLEQEAKTAVDLFREKDKQYTEQKKKMAAVNRVSISIYDVDINKVAYDQEKEEQASSSFFDKYYVCVRDKFREKDAVALEKVEGLFIESRQLVAKCTDGEVYEVLGQHTAPEQVYKAIETAGYYTKRPSLTREEYLAQVAQEKDVEADFLRVEDSVRAMVRGKTPRLFLLLVHVKVLALYIESLLRFGFPGTFGFFIVEAPAVQKVLSKWKRVGKAWKYSKRVQSAESAHLVGESEPIYDFVYRVVDISDKDPIREEKNEP
ncbi:V-type H+-transporting ATPase subunit C [Nematocida homosporus]|uniref:V-type H+-transporting ATPase subunit C n=1 Tax=Nematocida homosporus TaxID=1912981 RepID=UPI002220D165|nr:V-type H+-transporting ATPase subunit C [Nematocida homosporus]KAI5185279.1 V-type H+-transporting ATPase subunit C [Nematocida homosporus]